MSRSALNTWSQRVRQRLARVTGRPPLPLDELEETLRLAAQKLRLEPVILLGALAARPIPALLWTDVLRVLGRHPEPREEDWSAVLGAADAVVAAFPRQPLACWVIEPTQAAEVFVLASCLSSRAPAERIEIVATHSDPRMAELGRSGLVSETVLQRAPESMQLHFRHLGKCWQASPELRASVHFETAPPCELAGMQTATSAPGGYQLVVSRGQLARLGTEAARRLAVRLYRSLRADGFLLLGPGDHDERLFAELAQYVAPGVLLYRKSDRITAERQPGNDFASLLAAVEADPVAWEPRWQLATFLLREGYAESATCHLRELARWRPEFPGVWQSLAQAYTLAGDTASAEDARGRALLAAVPQPASKLLM